MSAPATVRRLPTLARALEKRYPGVRVWMCEWCVLDSGAEGITVEFVGQRETLIGYGLAHGGQSATAFDEGCDERGTQRVGGLRFLGVGLGGDTWHVVHHSYDGDPPQRAGRAFPPKWAEAEVTRILKRASRASRPGPRRA